MLAQRAGESRLRVPAFAAVYLLWGCSYLAIRFVVQVVPPFLAAGFRYSLSSAILLAWSFLAIKNPAPSRRQLLNCGVTGVVMFVFGYSAVYWAETRLASWLVAVLSSTGFLWTTLLEPPMLGTQRPRVATIVPLAGGLFGMFLLVTSPFGVANPGSGVAAVIVVASVVAWSGMTILLKKIDLPTSYVQAAGLQLAAAGSALLILSFALGEWHRLPAWDRLLQPGPILGMAYLVVGGSVIAFTAFHWLVAHESPSTVSSTTYVNPIVAMGAGILLFHERYSGRQLVGGAVVVLSVALVWRSKAAARRSSSVSLLTEKAASRG